METKTDTFSGNYLTKGRINYYFPVNLIFILSACILGGIHKQKLNLIFVFADHKWRAEAVDYARNRQVITPAIDKFVAENIVFTIALSTFPVCTPYRGMLMTGQYPLTKGAIMNGSPMHSDTVYIAEVFTDAGYQITYIGKWHLDGGDREAFIPKERRQ